MKTWRKFLPVLKLFLHSHIIIIVHSLAVWSKHTYKIYLGFLVRLIFQCVLLTYVRTCSSSKTKWIFYENVMISRFVFVSNTIWRNFVTYTMRLCWKAEAEEKWQKKNDLNGLQINKIHNLSFHQNIRKIFHQNVIIFCFGIKLQFIFIF